MVYNCYLVIKFYKLQIVGIRTTRKSNLFIYIYIILALLKYFRRKSQGKKTYTEYVFKFIFSYVRL